VLAYGHARLSRTFMDNTEGVVRNCVSRVERNGFFVFCYGRIQLPFSRIDDSQVGVRAFDPEKASNQVWIVPSLLQVLFEILA